VSYRVIWEDAALDQLDEIWKATNDKEGIRNTATRINTELKFNPLVVWFRVVERMNEVQVLHVRTVER